MSQKSEGGLQEQVAQLYGTYVDMVYRIAVLYLKEPVAAEDAVQEVFVKLMHWLARGRLQEKEHIKRWLIVTTKTTCMDELRRQKRQSTDPIETGDFCSLPAVWQSGQGPDGERLREVHDALMRLSEDCRLVMYLFYFEGYSSAEIAGMLHMNHSTVRGKLRTGRRRMRILLEEDRE